MLPSRSLVVCGMIIGAVGALARQQATPSCWSSAGRPRDRAAQQLPNGFRAVVERSADSLEVETGCSVRLFQGNRVVWSAQGFGTRIEPESGRDLDGDGVPEAVLSVDVGGGNRCCWSATILRLALPVDSLPLGFDPDLLTGPDGITLIGEWQADYGLGRSMAEAPAVLRVHRLKEGRLVNVTREYCPVLLGSREEPSLKRWRFERPPPEVLARSRNTSVPVPEDVEQVRAEVVPLALQHMVCGELDSAQALITATWPPLQADSVRRLLERSPIGQPER